MTPIIDKIATLWPEITLLTGACICMLIGLSPSAQVRQLPAWVAASSLWIAGVILCHDPSIKFEILPLSLPTDLVSFVKLAIVGVGLLLLLVTSGVPESLKQTRDAEAYHAHGQPFEPANLLRGEFFAFFLLSLTGAMLCAAAEDLVWLFLALELTSLPTYVMVATTRDRAQAQEAAVKYFFLGALAAAVFLYGFTLIYGATGSTQYQEIYDYLARQNATAQTTLLSGVSPLFMVGMVLAIVGVSFKIAAVPMHFYTADVYQGAAAPITAFLAFVPKVAGFVSLLGLLGLTTALGDEQRQPIMWLLWVMAVLTMTIGNVLGLLQTNVKRVLAYSSIAHTGYMLVGLIVVMAASNTATVDPNQPIGNGVAALVFYLITYGLATLGAFAVLGSVTYRGEEAQTFDDIAGLGRQNPLLGAIMLVSILSLIGLPPLVGFLGKIYLFGSAIQHGYLWLVVIAVLNSAVSAVYYLRIASACYFGKPNTHTHVAIQPARRFGAALAALAVLVLGIAGGRLVDAAHIATVKPSQSAADVASPNPTIDRLDTLVRQ